MSDDVTQLKLDLAEARMDRKLADVVGEMRVEFAKINGRLDAMPNAIMLRLGALMVVIAGLMVTALHYWH